MLFVSCQVKILIVPAFRGRTGMLSLFVESDAYGVALSGRSIEPSPGDGVDRHNLAA
jgi:hypothetical protein